MTDVHRGGWAGTGSGVHRRAFASSTTCFVLTDERARLTNPRDGRRCAIRLAGSPDRARVLAVELRR